MTRFLFAFIALTLASSTRFIARKWNIGYFVGGLVYGIYNEICFEFCWTYSDQLKPMVWRDVPLVVVLGWSIYTALALSISDLLVKKFEIKSLWIRKSFDVLLFVAIGSPIEVLMSFLGFWHYNMLIQGMMWMQIFGYCFVGVLVSCAGRSFQALLDRRVAGSHEKI